jgi:hypothetical protein
VLAGNHGSPTVSGTKQVTFLGDEGAVVGKMPGDCPCTFENIDIDTGSTHGQYNGAEPKVPGIVFKNVNITGDAPAIHPWASDFRWSGGSMSHRVMRRCGLDTGVPVWLNNDRATIEDVVMYPFRVDDPACTHGENIRVQGGDDIVIRRVTFKAGSDSGSGNVFVTTTSSSDPNKARRLVIEDSVFEPVIGSYAIQANPWISTDGWAFRRNRFDQPVLFLGPVSSSATFCGNTGQVDASWKLACP